MLKPTLLASASVILLGVSTTAFAQEAAPAAAPATADAAAPADEGEIIVTATRRAQALSDVPIAVSAVTAESLQNSGASDIRQLNQLSPSLLVSSTSSEAGAGVARIRGIGTVGDNPGLESSVAVFIDGVYRNRSGVALTELGAIDRIEVLRGPQGTLFGRNASAGLLNIVTAKPSFDSVGEAEITYGNYDFIRAAGSVTGGILNDAAAVRLDAVYVKRDGFLRDVISGRSVNDRDRYLVRGQMLFEPNDDLTIRLIGDYADRSEECCAATYLPARLVTPAAGGGVSITANNPIAALQRTLGATVNDTTFRRVTAITPGRDFRSDVTDWGLSGEINYDLGAANLTSITAYRDYKFLRGQDADYNNLDILYRDGFRQQFKTFTQEVRLQGTAVDDRLDWLVGAYYADETLDLADNLKYGADYDRYAQGVVGLSVPGFPGYNNLRAFATGALTAGGVPAAAIPTLTAFVPNFTLAGTGIGQDVFRQKSRNYAFFTHNIFDIVPDRLSLTVGLRYTNERKTLNASFLNTNTGCAQLLGGIAGLRGVTGALAPAATGLANNLQALAALPCVIPPVNATLANTSAGGKRSESEWSGTGVLSFKATEDLLTYASFSKGYKAGGFNLDRSALNAAAPSLAQLQFEPEKVDAYELGAKFDGRKINVNAALFYQQFKNFQLNTFNGINFIVENILACKTGLNGADADLLATTGACAAGNTKAGVVSKGVELEAQLLPTDDLSLNVGYTLADTQYRRDLVGFGGRPLAPTLFQLPGRQVSNAAKHVVTGAATWNPEIAGSNGLRGLVYADFRYQSAINTGSDLDVEKTQPGVMVVNARLGVQGPDRKWAVEFWAQNLFDVDYTQVSFDAPLQGSNTQRAVGLVQANGAPVTSSTALYGAFLAEPRTYGVTLRTRF
ncbi:MAG: TonB-dependent receptor [Alphaproteobacteria bacterium]|nr:TonB-dependent receptor [Alphaproteobacteria bacterium]